jgi:RHS repeat-associated protein
MARDADGDGDLYDDDSDAQNGVESWNVYFVQDHLYNVVALVYDDIGNDASAEDGTVVERAWYEPYGKATLTGADGTAYGEPASAWGNEHLFTGQRHSGETRTAGTFGLYYYKNRYYDPTLGRFITRDPAGYVGGMNLYGYVGSVPVSKQDPFGLWDKDGVLDILCKDPEGKRIVKEVLNVLTVYHFSTYDSKLQCYKEVNGKRVKDGPPVPMTTHGYTTITDKGHIIAVQTSLSNSRAASVMIHEATHVQDSEALSRIETEYSAHLAQEEFNLRQEPPIPPKDPCFRTAHEDGSTTINVGAMNAWIDRWYGRDCEVVDRTPVSKRGLVIEPRPWECPEEISKSE